MKSIIINLDQIKPEKIETNKKGQRIVRLTMAKLKTPQKSGVTHVLYHKTDKDSAKTRYAKALVGASIDKAIHIPYGNQDKFFMVFVEGGNTPAVQYATHDEALAQAVHLSTKLEKKAWVVESISGVNQEEAPELTGNETEAEMEVETPVKRQRSRIEKRPQKVYRPSPDKGVR